MEESSIFISCIDADNSEQLLSMYSCKAQDESNVQKTDHGRDGAQVWLPGQEPSNLFSLLFPDGPAPESAASPAVSMNPPPAARDGTYSTSLVDTLPANASEIQGVMFTQLFHGGDGPASVAAEASTAIHPANMAPDDRNSPAALGAPGHEGGAAGSSPTHADMGAISAAYKRRASVVGAVSKPPATSSGSSATAASSRRATVAGSMGSWGRPASPGASGAAARRSSVAGGSVPSYMRPTTAAKDKAKASETSATTPRSNSRLSRSPSNTTAVTGGSPARPPSTMAGEMEEYRKLLMLEGEEPNKVGPATSNSSPKGAIPSTEPSPFRLTTHIRAEWEDRLTPESAKLTTEEKQLRQAEKEQEALKARIAASGDSFRRAQEAPSKQAPPPQAPATEPQPFDLISAERHVEYRHAWALKNQQAEEKNIKASIFKAQDFDEGIKAGMYAHVTPRLAFVTESRAPAFMSDARAAKHAETDAQKRAFQEAQEQAQEADRIAKLSPRERELEDLHKRHMTKARPLPAFYKDRSANGGSPARAEQAHDTNPFATAAAEAKPTSSAEAEGVVDLQALDSVEPIVDDPFLNMASQAASDVIPMHTAEQACSAKEESHADQPAQVTAAVSEAVTSASAEIKVVEVEPTAAADSNAGMEVGATAVQPIAGPQATASPNMTSTNARASWPARMARAVRRMFVACSASHGALE